MVVIEICVGSSCHLKGAPDIVSLLEEEVRKNDLEGKVVLSGKFCAGKCNREGVTVTLTEFDESGQSHETDHIGITRENFRDFWKNEVMRAVENDPMR